MTQWANQGPVKLQRWATSSTSFEAASAKTALTTTHTNTQTPTPAIFHVYYLA